MYRYSTNDQPVALKEYFIKRFHDYPTRHVNDYNLTNNRKSFSKHAIRTNELIFGIRFLKQSKSVKHFRNQLEKKNHIETFE